MSEEITNTWELAELLERYAKMLKKAPKFNFKDPLDFEITGGPIYKADPGTLKDYGGKIATALEEEIAQKLKERKR